MHTVFCYIPSHGMDCALTWTGMFSLDDEAREAIVEHTRRRLSLEGTELRRDTNYNERVLALTSDRARGREWWQAVLEELRDQIGVQTVSMLDTDVAFAAFASYVR